MRIKRSIRFGTIGLAALGASLAFAGVSSANEVHKSEPALMSQAKISMEQARVIALKAHPGKITDEELEQEKGGSGLRYSFDIQKGKVTQEVGVDAKTSKVLENDPEGPNAD
jgi:uncharacterized membrane protein YkoI